MPDQKGDVLVRLVESVYDAAFGQQPWTRFAEELAEVFGSRNTHLLIVREAGHDLVGAVRSAPEHQRQYVDHFYKVNPYPRHPEAVIAPGRVHSGEWISKAEIMRTEFYNDFLVKAQVYPVLVANLFADADRMGFLATYRPLQAKPFGSTEHALMRALLPHVQRAVGVSDVMERLETERSRWLGSLDLLRHPIILLDDRSRPVLVNRAAGHLLNPEDGLAVSLDGLRASYPQDSRKLAALVASCLPGSADRLADGGGFVVLRRPSGRRPLVVMGVPVPHRSASRIPLRAPRAPAALLVVSTPDARAGTNVSPDLLATVFELTPREAEVASGLSRGLSIATVASDLGISFHTARVHQRRVYEKLAVHNQAELVRRLQDIRFPLIEGPEGDPELGW
jgi:DNA-binding CsgD family transcriptional regulator